MAETNTLTKRIGLLVPSSNTVMEPDFYRNLPEQYTLHTARMFLEDVNAETEARMLDEFALPAARDLASVQPDVVVFGCTSAGALRGNAFDDQLCDEISRVTGAPVVSVVRAVREALKQANVKRVVVVTPYVDELNIPIRKSLENDGLEVLRINGLGILQNRQIAQVPGREILRICEKTLEGLKPDALFVSCTNFPAVSILSELRLRLPFPVISSNQAALDATLTQV